MKIDEWEMLDEPNTYVARCEMGFPMVKAIGPNDEWVVYGFGYGDEFEVVPWKVNVTSNPMLSPLEASYELSTNGERV